MSKKDKYLHIFFADGWKLWAILKLTYFTLLAIKNVSLFPNEYFIQQREHYWPEGDGYSTM